MEQQQQIDFFDKEMQKNEQKKKKENIWELNGKEKWSLGNGKVQRQQLQKVFDQTSISKTNVKAINLQWNKMADVVELTVRCEFQALKSLNLGGNHILSLQLLAKINMFQLQELLLYTNKIVSLAPLRKMHTPFLKNIDLSSNEITQIGDLFELQTKKLDQINIEYNKIANVNTMVKIPFERSVFRVSILNNKLIRIVGKPTRDSRKTATYVDIPSGWVTYC